MSVDLAGRVHLAKGWHRRRVCTSPPFSTVLPDADRSATTRSGSVHYLPNGPWYSLLLQPGQQVGVDDVGVRGGHAVRVAVVGLQGPVLDQLGRQGAGVGVGHDLVVVAVHDQDGHGDLLEVVGEVGLGEGDDPVVVRFGAAHHALPPPGLDDRLGRLGAGPVVAVERPCGQVAVEPGAVGGDLVLPSVEDGFGQAAGVGVGLQHQRRNRADQYRPGHPAFAVPGDIVRHLAAACRVADVNGVVEI